MKSLEELKAIRERMQGQIEFRSEAVETHTRVVVGMGTCGIANGARPVLTTLSDAVQEKKLSDVAVLQSGCIGLCEYEPIVEVSVPGHEKITYIRINPEKALEIVEKHLIGGNVITEYTLSSVENK